MLKVEDLGVGSERFGLSIYGLPGGQGVAGLGLVVYKKSVLDLGRFSKPGAIRDARDIQMGCTGIVEGPLKDQITLQGSALNPKP